MKYNYLLICLGLILTNNSHSQSNMQISIKAENILKGNYDPATYTPPVIISDRKMIIDGIVDEVSADSLKNYLAILDGFQTRNTGSDTVSNTTGIGAARRWIRSKFDEFSSVNNNRLVTGYLQFDATICSMTQHRNVFAILPGLDTTKREVLVIEAHMDSRCEGRCDVNCYAPGMDDNGSGTVLVMELARVMSKYAFDRTIIFTTVTAEEQGLVGGLAWANYLFTNDIPVLACLNNDVIGGVECGKTSSPPGCSPEGDIDSLNVRIFSYSKLPDTAVYSQYKQLARYIKLQQIEEINPRLNIPMNIDLRLREDRDGRGGDHIPFRQRGHTSIRFSSSNEHGDGSGSNPDRQHTVRDELGKDTSIPPDGILDVFYVNFNYLRRNTIMNGVNLGLLASSPRMPQWDLIINQEGDYQVKIADTDSSFKHYRVGARSMGSGTLYYDTVFDVTNTNTFNLVNLRKSNMHFISVANVENGIESLFSEEKEIIALGVDKIEANKRILKSFPNPTSGELTIQFTQPNQNHGKGEIEIYSLEGRLIEKIEVMVDEGDKEFKIDLSALSKGHYRYFFFVNQQLIGSELLILSNDN